MDFFSSFWGNFDWKIGKIEIFFDIFWHFSSIFSPFLAQFLWLCKKPVFLFLHKNVLWKLFLLTGMRKSENAGMCSYNIPNVWWFGWPYLYSYTMFKLDKWDTKVLVRESWNSSFVWLAEPICHGNMSTLLSSWSCCCWSLLLLQFSSVITYVI